MDDQVIKALKAMIKTQLNRKNYIKSTRISIYHDFQLCYRLAFAKRVWTPHYVQHVSVNW